MRRVTQIECETFEFLFEWFKALVTECGEIEKGSVRDAITAFQGEMQGFYANVKRICYGEDIRGQDFQVEGIGEFNHIIHIDVKNAAGSEI